MESLPSWYYNEYRQIGTDYASTHEVEKYDARMRSFRDINGEIETIIAMTNLSIDNVLLEFGCGTGELLVNAAPKCKLVYGLDISPVMLEYAQQKINTLALKNIKLFHAGFLTYRHKDEPVDIAVSQLALHHLPDFWKAIALNQVYKLLKPGGYFFLRDVVYPSGVDYHYHLDKWITTVRSDVGENMAEDIIKHIRDEYSTMDWIMEGLLKRCGFTVEQKSEDGFLATYLCKK